MFDIAVIALVAIAIILYSSRKKGSDSDFLSIELFNLEKELKTLKSNVKQIEDVNETISKELAAAKRYNNYIYLARKHQLFDVLDEFVKQGSNLNIKHEVIDVSESLLKKKDET
tara:strand:+ start:583 stop:924 length:342 start_codon:yes stop_codon:yes gene_type:complete